MISNNLLVVIDIVLFVYIIIGLVNPSFWIKDINLKNDPKEQKKMRIAAVIFLVVEIAFCVFEYIL